MSPAGRHRPATGLSGSGRPAESAGRSSLGPAARWSGWGSTPWTWSGSVGCSTAARTWPSGSSPPASAAYAGRAADPVPRLSTRFAAKEATMKALGVGLGAFPFTDVEVVRHGLDAPSLVLHGRPPPTGPTAAAWSGGTSPSPTPTQVAMALVVAEGVPGDRAGPDPSCPRTGATKP